MFVAEKVQLLLVISLAVQVGGVTTIELARGIDQANSLAKLWEQLLQIMTLGRTNNV